MLQFISNTLKLIKKIFLEKQGDQIIKRPLVRVQYPHAEKVNLDDVIRRYLSSKNASDFFFLQIGAYDGITNDPISVFVRQHKWRGVLIEPQKEVFEELKENYREHPQLVFLNVAIADKDGKKDFYRVRNTTHQLPFWYRQIASLSLNTVLKHRNGIPDYGIIDRIANIDDLIEVERVNCITFDTLLNILEIDRIDLLQIDAEGYDFEILKTIDFERVKPKIIHYEHMHLNKEQDDECVRYLINQGYLIAREFENTVAYLPLLFSAD